MPPRAAPGWRAFSTTCTRRSTCARARGRGSDAGSPWRFTWNGLRALGVDEASLATFPGGVQAGHGGARGHPRRHGRAIIPEHWVGGLARPDLHAIAILFARDAAERERCVAEHRALRRSAATASRCSRRSISRPSPPFDYAHDHFGYRDRLSQPVIEGIGRRADAGLGRAAQGRASSSSAIPTRSARPADCRSPSPRAQRQLHGLPPPGRARRRVPRLPARARQDARGAGADRRQAHGPLAQRRAARPAPGQDDPALGADPQRNNDFNYKERGPARLRGAARLAHPAHEPARHGREHEPAPDDPPRRHLRPGTCRRARRTTASSAASPRS